jgi:hypothetical protein
MEGDFTTLRFLFASSGHFERYGDVSPVDRITSGWPTIRPELSHRIRSDGHESLDTQYAGASTTKRGLSSNS